jgi:hypothetical protein
MLVLVLFSGRQEMSASDACSCIQAVSSFTYATSPPWPVTGLTLCTFLESDLKSLWGLVQSLKRCLLDPLMIPAAMYSIGWLGACLVD